MRKKQPANWTGPALVVFSTLLCVVLIGMSMLSDYARREQTFTAEVNLPVSEPINWDEVDDVLRISVLESGEYQLDDEAVSIVELEQAIKTRFEKNNDLYILILADANTKHLHVANVMSVARSIGVKISHVAMRTLRSAVPDSPTTAIESFQRKALASIPKDLAPETKSFVVKTINDRKHLNARRLTCQSCFERIDGSLSQEERKTLILFGVIDDMRDHSGDCWEIMSFGGFGNGIEGYLDADTGELVLLWIVPEG